MPYRVIVWPISQPTAERVLVPVFATEDDAWAAGVEAGYAHAFRVAPVDPDPDPEPEAVEMSPVQSAPVKRTRRKKEPVA